MKKFDIDLKKRQLDILAQDQNLKVQKAARDVAAQEEWKSFMAGQKVPGYAGVGTEEEGMAEFKGEDKTVKPSPEDMYRKILELGVGPQAEALRGLTEKPGKFKASAGRIFSETTGEVLSEKPTETKGVWEEIQLGDKKYQRHSITKEIKAIAGIEDKGKWEDIPDIHGVKVQRHSITGEIKTAVSREPKGKAEKPGQAYDSWEKTIDRRISQTMKKYGLTDVQSSQIATGQANMMDILAEMIAKKKLTPQGAEALNRELKTLTETRDIGIKELISGGDPYKHLVREKEPIEIPEMAPSHGGGKLTVDPDGGLIYKRK